MQTLSKVKINDYDLIFCFRIACEPCNITFPSRANLRRHMRRKHEKKIVALELVKPELLVSQ